jgi:hypothetical protein
MESITYETLKRVQGDKKGITTQSLKGRGMVPPSRGRRCEKIGLVLFHVIPAPYQVRGKLQPESSVFMGLQILWTPVFTGETNTV